MSDKDKYIDKLQNKLEEGKVKIQKLEDEAKEKKTDAKDRVNKELDQLKQTKASLEKQIEELKTAGADAWDHLVDEANNAWTKLDIGFAKLFSSKTVVEYKEFCRDQNLDSDKLIEIFQSKFLHDEEFRTMILALYQGDSD
ncbi:MAG: hypothetical protein OEZ36_00740 [Spirochaetota bacterium]|nr:hypothetical protein [Spirochaetota bacterium]